MSFLQNHIAQTLDQLAAQAVLRKTPPSSATQGLVNLSSNDYLGLANDQALLDDFYGSLSKADRLMTSASSRLLTGTTAACERLEANLATYYGHEAALVFDSGYHANSGILPAIATPRTLILADKLIHASLIDGIRLAKCDYKRFHHNDLPHLKKLLDTYADSYEMVIVVTESIYSMDGDCVDLLALVSLKHTYPNVYLYLDEAHGIGVLGEREGLGMAHALNLHHDIDFLVGTLGKGMASQGAYIVCDTALRSYLVNTVRPFIFTTALPPIQCAWTDYLFAHRLDFQERRRTLATHATHLRETILATGRLCPSTSQIIPYLIGESADAIATATTLQQAGFYVMPVRPPTVPPHTARLRFSLSATIPTADIHRLCQLLTTYSTNSALPIG